MAWAERSKTRILLPQQLPVTVGPQSFKRRGFLLHGLVE